MPRKHTWVRNYETNLDLNVVERHLTIQSRIVWNSIKHEITNFMWPTWGPSGSCRLRMGPILAPLTLPSGRGQKVQGSSLEVVLPNTEPQISHWATENQCYRSAEFVAVSINCFVCGQEMFSEMQAKRCEENRRRLFRVIDTKRPAQQYHVFTSTLHYNQKQIKNLTNT